MLADKPCEGVEKALWPRGKYHCEYLRNGLRIHDQGTSDHKSSRNWLLLERAFFNEPSSLTSITLDWVLFQTGVQLELSNGLVFSQEANVLSRLCSTRFPNLRSFQMRNCISSMTELDPNVFLFQGREEADKKSFLDFLEAHPNLECLAWPMSRFFAPAGLAKEAADRARRVVANLGRTLTDLRVDALLTGAGEPVTDDSPPTSRVAERTSRRLFITEFAQHMKALTSIKMEGGIPRDEKRETARALRRCPLEKLVFIGASFPAMNTWGEAGEILVLVDEGFNELMPPLHEENDDMIAASASWELASVDLNSTFYPEFGRDHQPMLYTLASHFAPTMQQLKFCGYLGSPILQNPSEMTHPALSHLRHFHALREVVVSFWLLTFFDRRPRDEEIIKYWLDMRSPQSTALAIVPPEVNPQVVLNEVNPMHEAAAEPPLGRPDAARWLYENYHPANLAERVSVLRKPA